MGKTDLLLSIIIPVYNTELYLEECVESLLNQNLENFEIIFVNDGSTDNSKTIMLRYQEEYPYIHYFEQENAGQGKARNFGLQQAKGTYIYFMDSDDYLLPGALNKMLTKASADDLDAIYFNGKSFYPEQTDKNGEPITEDHKQATGFYSKEYGFYSDGEQLLHDLSINNNLVIQPCLYLVKKEIYDIHELYFPENHIHEDQFVTVTLFLYVRNLYHTDEIVFMRRIRRQSSVTNQDKKPSFLGYVNVLPYFDSIYETHNFQTAKGKAAYRKKIKQLTKSAYVTYGQVEDKTSVQKAYQQLEKFRKKMKSFGFLTHIFLLITKYPNVLEYYQRTASKIKKL